MASKNFSRESQLSITAAPFLYKSSFTKALPWRIKQLVSHRRSRTFDDAKISIAESERHLGGKLSGKPFTRRSWIDGKASIDIPFIEDGNENRRQKEYVRRSSSPSLSYSLSTSPKILYFQPDEDRSDLSGDALSWSLIFSAAEELRSPPSRSTFDLLEALSLEPSEDDDQTPTPTPTIKLTRNSSENEPGFEVSEGIERLIRETDEAFKGISTVIVPGSLDSVDPNVDTKEVPKKTDIDKQVLKKRQRKLPKARSTSISKAKRTKSTKKRARLLDLASTSPPSGASPFQNQRWTQLADMTENISEIFSGRMFGKMEVNELIDTTRIGRAAFPEREAPTESTFSHGIDDILENPSDPFFLENVPSRLDSSSIIPTPPDPTPSAQLGTSEAPTIPVKSALRSSRRDSAIYVGNGISILTTPGNTDISMPPVDSIRQRSRSYPKQPSLPTIEEVSPLTPDSKTPMVETLTTTTALQATSSESLIAPTAPTPQENHIILTSSPFTLTAPHFQHGSIRLPRGKKRAFKSTNSSSNTPKQGEIGTINKQGDSALDWTAFEMTISGGTGNYLMGGAEPDEMEGYPEEIEDLALWWKGFGFAGEGMGRLIDAGTAAKMHQRKKSKLTSGEVGISYELDANPLTIDPGNTNVPGEMNTTADDEEMGEESLPPSPMDDLAVLERRSLQRFHLGELVPMGFNLSHDLDDYLNWEKGACTKQE